MRYIKIVIVSILLTGVLALRTQSAYADFDGNDSELRRGKITFYEEDTIPPAKDSNLKPLLKKDENNNNKSKKIFPNTGENQLFTLKYLGLSILVLVGLVIRYYKKGEYM